MTPRLPYGFARRHGVVVTGWDDGEARVAVRSGATAAVLAEARRALALPLAFEAVAPDRFDELLAQAYQEQGGRTAEVMEGVGDELDLDHAVAGLAEPEDLLESEDEAPIIRFINALLGDAIKEGASDIHVEPFEQHLSVRLRVDGVLREVARPRAALAPLLASRIKVMARLDIAEKRLPQDGRISLRIAGRAVDVRVSTMPTNHGERVVLRLLDKQAGRLDLEHLGMRLDDRERLDRLIHKPHGILLVTGPTGSGKTTTLYAALSRLNDRRRNIMTVEDPIEYNLEGIAQTQVNSKVEMSFARGLRAILRQDPDVVMVGEMRDLETAAIAVQASLTGHMVFSTLHTNSAVASITRLRDMGVEPFLLASSLIGVLAQRLVRRLCPACRRPYPADARERELLGLPADRETTLYAAEGCDECSHSGYRGRSGIYELVAVDDGLRTLIHNGDGEQALERAARRQTQGIRSDGVRRVVAGETTVEELLRVTSGD